MQSIRGSTASTVIDDSVHSHYGAGLLGSGAGIVGDRRWSAAGKADQYQRDWKACRPGSSIRLRSTDVVDHM